MFKVEVDSLEAYFAFDPLRRAELEAFDRLMVQMAPRLARYFHRGTPAGQPGMRFKMIGYGLTLSETGVEWPRVGVALQKNDISVYLAEAAVQPMRGRLGKCRIGRGHFSFVRFADLDADAVARMLGTLAAEQG